MPFILQILAKKQNRFWIHEFPQKTYPGKYLNQCLQYIVILPARLFSAWRQLTNL